MLLKNLEPRALRILQFSIALMGGLAMGFATAPVKAWYLAWIALVPLWVLTIADLNSQESGKKLAFPWIPLVWGIGYHGCALSWILGIHPMTWLGVPWWPSLAIALFCWIFITIWGATLVGVWGGLLAIACRQLSWISSTSPLTRRASLARILLGTALWCALESLWSLTPLWWTSLSYTQSPHNLAILHLGQLSGPTAVTASLVAVNGAIAEAWIWGRRQTEGGRRQKSGVKFLGLAIGLSIVLHLIGFILYSRPLVDLPERSLKIGLIQGNIPNQIKFDSAGWQRALEGYTTGYQQLANQGVDAVLIPETALPFIWTDPVRRSYLSFYQAILERGVVAWVGGFGQQERSITNSLFTIDGQGKLVSRYDKTKLVPLGEYIPFEKFIGRLINRLSPLDAHLVPGKPNQIFETPFGRAIIGICYDSAFAEHFRRQAAAGGEFILTASNDAHYTSAMMAQHHSQDVMRAIETDRWAVRATNTGYSAFVNPRGETLWLSTINQYEVQASIIDRRQTKTLYVRWGDWLMPVLLLLSGLVACQK